MCKSMFLSAIKQFIKYSLICLTTTILFLGSPAIASETNPSEALSDIDTLGFSHPHEPNEYVSTLTTLSQRCSDSPEHIAEMSFTITNYLKKEGRIFDNFNFLKQAMDATQDGTFGQTCETMFAVLGSVIEKELS